MIVFKGGIQIRSLGNGWSLLATVFYFQRLKTTKELLTREDVYTEKRD